MDILRKPEAKAVIEREAPALGRGMASLRGGDRAPSLTGIMTLRTTAESGGAPGLDLAKVDLALRALPVTPADQQARCERYDEERVELKVPAGRPRLLVFEKMTGFRDGPSVEAARAAIQAIATRKGWAVAVTDKGGAITPANLRKFDAVIWNNVSGDVLTMRQRRAFKTYIEGGGGFVGIHGTAGDFVYYWDWYVDTLLGTRFLEHTYDPQFYNARINIESSKAGIGGELAPGWTMNDEWYSFTSSPRLRGAHVIATLDEGSYTPKGRNGRDLRMGDHPIAWTRCVGNGRVFYSAIGHRAEGYSEPHHVQLLEDAIAWAAGAGTTRCRNGKEISR
jgi:type 1 glutamine amidotransferase